MFNYINERERSERGMFLFKYWILCLLIEQSSNSCCVYSRTQYIIYTVFICNKWNQNLKLFWFLKGICPIHKQLGLIHMIHIWKSYVDYIHVICFIRDHKKASYLNHVENHDSHMNSSELYVVKLPSIYIWNSLRIQ